jgi:hypothetical protein
VESGRFRGGFSGCADSIGDQFAIALAGQRLFGWCPDGTLLTWNAANALAGVAEFENSLKPSLGTAIGESASGVKAAAPD